jgi:hypothetical protein
MAVLHSQQPNKTGTTNYILSVGQSAYEKAVPVVETAKDYSYKAVVAFKAVLDKYPPIKVKMSLSV